LRILVVGASGFIGSVVCARLAADGHEVVGVSRGMKPAGLTAVRHVRMDMSKAIEPEDWFAALHGVDAAVNCAGVLQDSPGESTRGVHSQGATSLFAACERRGVRRVVHISAIGVNRASSGFSETKRAGDAALIASNLDWFILRPSVVIGRAAYGGSALLRGLATLPILPVIDGIGSLQLVHLDESWKPSRFAYGPRRRRAECLSWSDPNTGPLSMPCGCSAAGCNGDRPSACTCRSGRRR
jgi:uncharacterized protein YbjT (DUF2867 family)